MRTAHTFGLALVVLLSACAAGRTTATDPAQNPGNTAPPGENEPAATDEDPATAPPHALGTIVLGETRATGTGDSNPIISASFVPDAKLTKSCTKKMGACEVTQVPTCVTGTIAGCASGEVCAFNDSCEAKCIKGCTKACDAGEVCYFTGSNVSSSSSSGGSDPEAGMSCKKKERFDAGAIAFQGTTQSITLFPPYGITPNGNGAPFMARSEIRVQASGGTAAGFEKFDDKFLSTTFLETNPPLSELSRTEVFGSGALAIGWVPGEDTVTVTASGPAGSAKCTADDKSGTFSIPRDVIREVSDASTGTTSSSSGSSGSSGSLSITVTRERREVKKDKKTFGELGGGQIVQPQGWVELITRSSETHSYASCSTGLAMCGEQCVSLQSDAQNCGTCGKKCTSGYYCSAGVCRY